MPLSYVIVDEAPQVRVVGTGSLSMSAMISVMREVAADPLFHSHFTVTFDLREASYTAELADGDTLAAVLRQKKSDFQNRFALVVPESLHFLAKLYCSLVTMGGFENIKSFTSMDRAQEWCRMQA